MSTEGQHSSLHGVAADANVPVKLNLGSGNKKHLDAFNVDLVKSTSPDLVHDLNVRPWPLPGGHFNEVYANDVIEHLHDVVASMEEIHRVCVNGAILRITVPHFSSGNAFTDPTHRHYFSAFSFNYFTGEHEFSFYTDKRFRTLRRQIIFYPSLLARIIWRLANRWPAAYERRWAWMFPAWFISFELEVIKPSTNVERD